MYKILGECTISGFGLLFVTCMLGFLVLCFMVTVFSILLCEMLLWISSFVCLSLFSLISMVRTYSAEWLSNNVVRVDCKVTEYDTLLYSVSCLFEDECVLQISSTVFSFTASVSIAHDIAVCINRGTLVARKCNSIDDFNDNPGLFE